VNRAAEQALKRVRLPDLRNIRMVVTDTLQIDAFSHLSPDPQYVDRANMLAVPPYPGRDIVDAMFDAAESAAAERLCLPIRFARCEGVEVREGYSLSDVAIECWSVRADHQAVVIAAFATALRPDGGQNMAASGRFTFTTLANTRESYA
jgi:hypothetical protein